MFELIAFDWDDVFTTGSTAAYHACYFKAARDAGATVSKEEVAKTVDELWGRPHEVVIKSFLEAEPALFEKVNENYESYIQSDAFLDHLVLVDGSLEMLKRLRKNYLLAIVSGINPQLLKEKVFPKFDVPDVFAKVVTSYELKDRSRGKPHPDMLEMVLKSLHISPSETIYVGDSQGDMQMAQATGALPIAVLTGQLGKTEAEKSGAKYILNNVTELEGILSRLS